MVETNVNSKFIKTSNTKAPIALFFCFIFFFGSANAQETHPGTNESDYLWGIGTSITYPLGGQIYMLQASYSVSQMGDVLTGFAYQDWKNDQGHSHAYTLLIGYRQFIWKGFHTEAELWPAYNPFHSSVDGKIYKGLELWLSLRIGYRFDFDLGSQDLFILLQPGVGFGIARQNPWPKLEEDSKAIFEPQLIVGIRF